MRNWILKASLACGLAALMGQATAENFPSHPIKIVVGFAPGGVADISARIVAKKLTDSLGTQVFVENMPSAGGIVAAMTVAKAAPDGYTLLLVSNQNAVSPALMKSLPYDPAKDFSMISTLGFFDLVMVTAPSSPFKTTADVLAAARRNPSHFNIGTIGVGSTQHLSAELFKSLAKLDVPTVPYKGSGNVILAVQSGDVAIGFETLPAVVAQLKSGSLRALAVTSDNRSLSLPAVPTLAESGVPGYQSSSWNGLAAPARTPKDVVARLHRAIAEAMASPETRKRLQEIGIQPWSTSPEAFKALLDKEIVKWRGVVAQAKIEKQ